MAKRSQQDSTENKILGDLLLQMINQGNLIDSLQQIIQNWIMTVLGLLKSGKVRLRRTIDRQVAPHREEPLLDGTAQSVKYGETPRDR